MQLSARGSVVQNIQCFFGAGKISVFLSCLYIVYDMMLERDRLRLWDRCAN